MALSPDPGGSAEDAARLERLLRAGFGTVLREIEQLSARLAALEVALGLTPPAAHPADIAAAQEDRDPDPAPGARRSGPLNDLVWGGETSPNRSPGA